jgi:hypothetical protein
MSAYSPTQTVPVAVPLASSRDLRTPPCVAAVLRITPGALTCLSAVRSFPSGGRT